MRAVVEHGWRPTAWQPACRIPSLELNHEWQKPRYIHVAAPAWRNHRHSGHLGGIRLMVQRMVHVERVGREHPSAIHQYLATVVEPERRHQGDPRRPLEAASGPGPLGREIVDTAGSHAPLARAVNRQSAPHFECRQRQACRQHRIARPPPRQAIELPDTGADAPCRDDDGTDREIYVAALHNSIFSARESRLMAASRCSAFETGQFFFAPSAAWSKAA